MNADRLLALYGRVADTPDAIARLRRFVLDLAVRGKLVEQDPADEPASELLKRIAAEKARLVKVGEIKPRKLKSRPRQYSLEFLKPSGWKLTDLGSVALKITDGAHKTPTYVQKGVPFVSVKDFSTGRLDLGGTRFIPLSEHEVLYKRCDPRRGDILLGRIGTLGKAVLVDTDVEFSLFVSVGLIRFNHANTDPYFFRIVLNSPFVKAEFDRIKIGGGTHTNKLNLGDLHTVAFPLPPLAEQHRIVAKVDELMALCDRLEEARTAREDTRDRLTKASLARLSAPDADDVTFRSHTCIALDALPALTARADQIKHLRQTILNLAVRGKLVEQDPADEPAAEFLKHIDVERAETHKAKNPKSYALKAGAFDGEFFDLPTGWEWVPLARISDITMGQSPPGDTYNKSGDGVPLINGPVEFTPGPFGRTIVNQFTTAPTNFCEEGDFLICVRGSTTGRTNVAALRACIGRGVAAISSSFDDAFVRLFLWRSREEIISMGRGVAFPSISRKQLENLTIPLSPTAEQHRIVAKVDELMTLCDRLETGLAVAAATRSHLLASLLREALD